MEPDVERDAGQVGQKGQEKGSVVMPTAERSGKVESNRSSYRLSQSQSSHGDEKEFPLPKKRQASRVVRYLAHTFFSYYRKIFAFIFTASLIALVVLMSLDRSSAALMKAVQVAVSANLAMALLFRQENFINLLYSIFASVPHCAPFWIRRRCAKFFHYGGAHSGCGVAAVVWHLLYTALATKIFVEQPSSDVAASLITSWLLVVMFVAMLVPAHPRLRKRYHDQFEYTHRFAGWAVLAIFWVHLILGAEVGRQQAGMSLGLFLIESPNLWLLMIATACLILSWGRLRHREVVAEKLSDHATRLRFKYRAIKPFYGIKFSDRPLMEWHAFATIQDVDAQGKSNGFSVIVSNAGDWTRRNIMQGPKKLWIRGAPLLGLLYSSHLFKRIVVVATGSGIGPMLSLMIADATPRRVLWSTKNPKLTYGNEVVDTVLRADPNAIIWDSQRDRRPDMVALTYHLYKESDAEAVFIISNPALTQKVVYGMESRGIAAYGAIFDS